MKSSLALGVVTVALAGGVPALAADMPLKAPAPYVWTWTGGYLGLSAGGMSGSTQPIHGTNDPTFAAFPGPETDPFKVHGGLVGFTDGYNVQFGRAVIGYEGDWSLSLATGEKQLIPPVFNPVFSDKVGINNLSTWRARAGFLMTPDWLIYGTGGAALANMTFTQSNNASTTNADTKYVWGWAAGGGVEWKFDSNFSLKAEYIHVGLNNTSFIGASAPVGAFLSDNKVKLSEEIVRVGLNWHVDILSILVK